MATLSSLEQKFLARQTNYTLQLGQKIQLDRQIQEARVHKERQEKASELYSQTQALLLHVSSTARVLAQSKIEELVSLALVAITGEPYAFKMDLHQAAGAWTVSFSVISPSGVTADPLDGCGGGIADICSMALRIAILEMYEPRIEGPILLDENFKFLSRDHIRAAAEFLESLSERTGRQILLITHVPELAEAAATTIEVRPQGSTSVIEVVD